MKNNWVWKNKRNEKKKKSLRGVGGWVGRDKKKKKIEKMCNWDVRLEKREGGKNKIG